MTAAAGRTVWWDFDGTLVSRPLMWPEVGQRLIDRVCTAHGVPPAVLVDGLEMGMPWHRADHAHPELSTPALWWAAVRDRYAEVLSRAGCGSAMDDEGFTAIRADILDSTRYRVFDDVVPVLSRLRERGWRHVVVSNHVPELDDLVTGLRLRPLFDAVVTSGLVGYEKPHRRLFEAAVTSTRPGTPVWMVGDSLEADCHPVGAFCVEPILVRGSASVSHSFRHAPDLWSVLELIGGG
jgi:putative hydrolase of the HAD superfamily